MKKREKEIVNDILRYIDECEIGFYQTHDDNGNAIDKRDKESQKWLSAIRNVRKEIVKNLC